MLWQALRQALAALSWAAICCLLGSRSQVRYGLRVQVGAIIRESAGGAAEAGMSNGSADPGSGEWAVLEGHPRGVTALACTTDGGYLLSGKLL